MAQELKVCSEYFVTVGDRFETRSKISTPVAELGATYLDLSEEDEGNIVHIAAAREILSDTYLGINKRRYLTDTVIQIWPVNVWPDVRADFDMLETANGWDLPSSITDVRSDLL